jgi:dTDP-4-amino-4,6-dideoxygalactose transaminase
MAQWILTRPSLFGLPAGLPWLGLGETVFRSPHPVAGLTAVAAGVLESTMAMADRETEVRRRNAALLRERLRGSRLDLVQAVAGARPGWLRMPARLRSGEVQSLGRDATARSLGIYPSYPGLLGELPGMAERVTQRTGGFPGARQLVEQLLTLPTHSAVHGRDLERIVAWAARAS